VHRLGVHHHRPGAVRVGEDLCHRVALVHVLRSPLGQVLDRALRHRREAGVEGLRHHGRRLGDRQLRRTQRRRRQLQRARLRPVLRPVPAGGAHGCGAGEAQDEGGHRRDDQPPSSGPHPRSTHDPHHTTSQVRGPALRRADKRSGTVARAGIRSVCGRHTGP
jgi:hypothetical protein